MQQHEAGRSKWSSDFGIHFFPSGYLLPSVRPDAFWRGRGDCAPVAA